jgi:hypothetical protein
MNDLVSEYQQYQDATAEGKFLTTYFLKYKIICLSLLQKKVKVVKKKANKKVPKSANEQRKNRHFFFHHRL